MLIIRCLGILEVQQLGVLLQDLAGSLALRQLLGYLILRRGEVMERGHLATLFWPEASEEQARRALNTRLWRLRDVAKGATTACLQTTPEHLRWELPPGGWLDLEQFETLVQPSQRRTPDGPPLDSATLRALEEAVGLYRGPLLTDCEADWCEPARQRFHERYVLALEQLIRGYEQRGALARALSYAEALVDAEPYYETGHAALIRINLSLNRPQAVQLAYNRYAQLWQAELGLRPSKSLHQPLWNPPSSDAGVAESGSTDLMQATLGCLLEELELPKVAQSIIRQPVNDWYDTLAGAAMKLAQAAEQAGTWTVARQGYETALAAMQATLEPDLRQQLAVRLRANTLYDRAALRAEQAANLNVALFLAERLGDKAGQSEVWSHRCWLAQREGRLQEAIRCAEQALGWAGEEPQLRAQALRLLGVSHQLGGNYRVALAYQQRSLMLAADLLQLSLDHINLASTCDALGEIWQARLHAQAALAHLPDDAPLLIRALALGNLATSARELGLWDEAAAHLQAAQALATSLEVRETEAWLACRAATLYRWRNDLSQAEVWATRAWSLSRTLAGSRYVIEAALAMGQLEGQRGEVDGVSQWLRYAEERMQATGLWKYRSEVALAQARLALRRGRVAAASRAAGRARMRLRATGSVRRLLLCYALQAVVAYHQGNLQGAMRRLNKAQATLHQQADAIPDKEVRAAFLAATPLRHLLNEGADLATVAALWATPSKKAF